MTAANKVYDGTTAATVTSCTLTGVVGSDVGDVQRGTATFDTARRRHRQDGHGDRDHAERRGGGNYTLASTTATTTANITAVTLTATVTAANKVYDGTTAATVTSCTLTGVVGGDVVTCSAARRPSTRASVGTGKTVTVTGITLSGAAAGNYTLASTTATTTANITAVTLTATVTAANKVYDGTTAATIDTAR